MTRQSVKTSSHHLLQLPRIWQVDSLVGAFLLIADNAAKIGNTQSMAFTIADYTHQIDDIDVPKASQYPLSMNLNSETAVICLFGNFWKLPMFGSQSDQACASPFNHCQSWSNPTNPPHVDIVSIFYVSYFGNRSKVTLWSFIWRRKTKETSLFNMIKKRQQR